MTKQSASGLATNLFLVVDVHKAFREVLRFLLERWFPDFDLTEASTCTEAWEVLRDRAPALVVLDHELVNGGGLDLIRRIRKVFSGTPIIVMSNQDDLENQVSVCEAGATRFCSKWQFEMETARRVLEKVLRRRTVLPLARRRGTERGNGDEAKA